MRITVLLIYTIYVKLCIVYSGVGKGGFGGIKPPLGHTKNVKPFLGQCKNSENKKALTINK